MGLPLTPKRSLKLDTVVASPMGGTAYSKARSNVQQKPLSAWQDENMADGPWICALGSDLQLVLQNTLPQIGSGNRRTTFTS